MAIKLDTTPTYEKWGSAQFVPSYLVLPVLKLFDTQSLQEKYALHHACPIPRAVAEYYAKTGANGHEKGFLRYNECNEITAKLWKIVSDRNPDLYHKLTTWKPRLSNEKVGKYENGRVPIEHLTELSPLSTIFGYAFPRVIIEILKVAKKRKISEGKIWQKIIEFADKAQDPDVLLALLSGYAVESGVPQITVFHHIFAQGVMDEERTKTDFRHLMISLNQVKTSLIYYFIHTVPYADKVENGLLLEIP